MAKIRMSAGRLLAVALVGGGALTLLFWAKLRLMTQVPRAAYAEPETTTGVDQADDSPAEPGTTRPADPASDDSPSPKLVDASDDLSN